MINTFRAYDPSSITAKTYSTACEACYARKVKCEVPDGETACKQCLDHNVECKARTRKRKAPSVDDGQRGSGENGVSNYGPDASKREVDGSDVSSSASKRRMSTNYSGRPGGHLQRSSSISVPDLFVNRDSGTGFSPVSSEQTETPAQDKFRNASFISRSAILGTDFQDIDHAHADRDVSEDKVSSTELKVLRLYGAFELPDLPLRQSLIEAYIERCYTWMPVVNLSTFTGPSANADGSLLLLQAVILVGALMRPDVCSKAFCDRQYQKVKALIHSNYERNPLNIIASLCLVQWYTSAAPKDISVDVPRFWNTYAVGLAQQMGLQRPSSKALSNSGLRNRVFWTMVARDNITASAHGRPRILQPEDCLAAPPTMEDFGNQVDTRAEVFLHYVAITRILGDLCQLMTRHGEINPEERRNIGDRLQGFLETLPQSLRLYSPTGAAQQYSLDIAQLHIPVLIAVTILFRPPTVYQLTAANAGSVAAAFLSFRVFQAIELREHTKFLSSAFSWHLLVTAIPLLSCTKVSVLQDEANEALDAVESVLETLGRVRVSAATNLQSVKAIRKAMSLKSRTTGSTANPTAHAEIQDSNSISLAYRILHAYGSDAVRQYEQIVSILGDHSNSQAERSAHDAAHTLSCLSGGQGATPIMNGRLTPQTESYMLPAGVHEDIQNAFTAVFEDDTLGGSWMMRDWMDELQL